MKKCLDKKLPNKRKFGIISYLREKLRMQRDCRIPKFIIKKEKVTFGIQGGYYEYYRKKCIEGNDPGKCENIVP